MRTDIQLIQSALADYDYPVSNINLDNNKSTDYFNFYAVELPEKFKGLPSTWYFAIHKVINPEDLYKESINESRKLIQHAIKVEELPLAIIHSSKITFSGTVQFANTAVFFITIDALPIKKSSAFEMRDTPILVAVKNKFTKNEAPFWLSPYTPNNPVMDWRFFGRKKEIKDLVESNSNYFVVGARRIGKTSLLKEAKRLLEENNQIVHFIPVQEATTLQAVIELIAQKISAKYSYKAMQLAKEIDLNYLTTILKRLKGDKKRIILIFDELGNVLEHNKRDEWKFIGTLRELSQTNDIRIIISAFQEIFIKQYSDFSGPYINFGTIMKVNVFSNSEIDDIITDPLSVWVDIPDKKEFNKSIRKYFGRQPLILQYLGFYLFQKILLEKRTSISSYMADIIKGHGLKNFRSAIDDVFTYNNSYLERYLFLKICITAAEKNAEIDLTTIDITHSYVETLLKEVKVESTLDERLFLLERMSMKGLLYQDEANFSIYHIGSPIVFYYLKQFHHPIEGLCSDYRKEIDTLELSII